MEEESEGGHVGDGQKEVDVREMFVLLHEEVGPVAEEEVPHDKPQFRHREKESVARICREQAKSNRMKKI